MQMYHVHVQSFVSYSGQGSAAFMTVIKLLCRCYSNPDNNQKNHEFALW